MTHRRPSARLIALAFVGLGLALAPVLCGMFHRAPLGAQMMRDFDPLMTQERLSGFQADIAEVDAAVHELDPIVRARPGVDRPAYSELSGQWPEIHSTMSSLMGQVSANRDGYEAVASLPDFTLLPWFFAAPGVLVALLAGYGLLRGHEGRRVRWPVLATGVALIALPVTFGMFGKAPQGARMMSTFQSIETSHNVARIQGYFATMAAGQGAMRLDIAPALARAGVPHPATDRLNADWIHVLNDMTPMIGAMSDNVDNYDAVASLPSFALFPWFFVAPGALLVLLALPLRKARP